MGWIITLLGIVWIIVGIAGLVRTKQLVLTISNIIKNTGRQSLGLISLIIGVLILISASSAREGWFVLILGIMACLKGATIILLPEKTFKEATDWWLAAPKIIHKGWAAFLLILGAVILSKI